MFFDGVSRINQVGELVTRVGVLLVDPSGCLIPHAFTLTKPCSNNIAEYQSLIIGTELAIALHITHLHILGDSQLIINQLKGGIRDQKPDIQPYHGKAQEQIARFEEVVLQHIPRKQNEQADALAGVATAIVVANGGFCEIKIC